MVMIMKTNYNLFIEQEFNNDPELKKMYEEELELLRIAKQISDVRKKQKLTQEQMARNWVQLKVLLPELKLENKMLALTFYLK